MYLNNNIKKEKHVFYKNSSKYKDTYKEHLIIKKTD